MLQTQNSEMKEQRGLFPASPGNSLGRAESLLPKQLIKTCQLNRPRTFRAMSIHQSPRRIPGVMCRLLPTHLARDQASHPPAAATQDPALLGSRGELQMFAVCGTNTHRTHSSTKGCPFLLRNPTGSCKKLEQLCCAVTNWAWGKENQSF